LKSQKVDWHGESQISETFTDISLRQKLILGHPWVIRDWIKSIKIEEIIRGTKKGLRVVIDKLPIQGKKEIV